MERRNWLWKKKSSDKVAAAPEICDLSNLPSSKTCDDNNGFKTVPEYTAIPEGLQPEEMMKLLNERLAAAQSELLAKETLVKQHMKVAEEAISGWEKSEVEAVSLKKQLDEALQKASASEDRVSHLDSALKECVRQLRLVREEQEQKMHAAVTKKTREWDEVRLALEGQLSDISNQLTQSGAHANAMSKSLQERTRTILELNDAKVRAEAEYRLVQTRSETVEKEYAALKYDFQVLQKELEIRNEEKEYSKRMLEAANKQQLESVKKTGQLEAECQRLRILLRKKLPGRGALAQMRVEAESLGKDSAEGRKKSVARSGRGLYAESVDDFCQLEGKENEALLDRLQAMEEETTMLKEILTKKNNELQEARLTCAKTASKLSNVEEQLSRLEKPLQSVQGKDSSTASVSEEVNSWTSTPISIKSNSDRVLESTNFDLMDDFIEMEQLASIDKQIVVVKDEAFEAVLARKEEELQHANQMREQLHKKLATAEAQLEGLLCRSVAGEVSFVNLDGKDKLEPNKGSSDNIDLVDAESKARLRSAVCRIIHLIESLAQEYSTECSPAAETTDGGVKRLVSTSKNFLQGKVPMLDFVAELSCVLDFVVGLSVSSGSVLRRSDSVKSSEQSQRTSGTSEYMQEVLQLKAEIADLERNLQTAKEAMETMKTQLSNAEQEVCMLQEQLAPTEEAKQTAQTELAEMALLKDKLESRVNAADIEIRQLRENIITLKTELQEERKRHQEVVQKLQQQMPGNEEALRLQKEQELVAAAEKLAECQRTIHVLGKQLESLGLPTTFSEPLAPAPTRHVSHISELPPQYSGTLTHVQEYNRDHIQKQETYWSSSPLSSEGFGRRMKSEVCAENSYHLGPSLVGVPESPLEVRTPSRFYRKSKARGYATTELSKSLNAADLSIHSEKHGVLGIGRFFSRAKANH